MKEMEGAGGVGVEAVERSLQAFCRRVSSGEVDDDLRRQGGDCLDDSGSVADVDGEAGHPMLQASQGEEALRRRRPAGKAHEIRTQLAQPDGEPASKKTCVAGHEHATIEPECRIDAR